MVNKTVTKRHTTYEALIHGESCPAWRTALQVENHRLIPSGESTKKQLVMASSGVPHAPLVSEISIDGYESKTGTPAVHVP